MKNFLIGFIVSISLFSFAQNPTVQTGSIRDGALDQTILGNTRGGSVLFSTFSGIAPMASTVTSQAFTDPGFGGYLTAAADDFTIPGATGAWLIEEINVEGTYFNLGVGPTGPAASLNVYIIGNSGSLPDSTNLSAASIYAAENLSYIDNGSGDFLIPLPGSGILLPPGTYWLCIQANMSFEAAGQWGWTESSAAPDTGTVVGFESAWFQSAAILSGTCVNAWGARTTTCMMPSGTVPPLERDLAFELVGQDLTPAILVVPTSGLETSEAGGSAMFSVVLNAPPTMNVTIDLSSSDATEVLISTGGPAVAMTSLVFGPGNWDIPQIVTVIGQDDAIADGNVSWTIVLDPAVSGDTNYSGLDGDDPGGLNFDNDIAGITVLPISGLITDETGATAMFAVSANTPPTDDVMVPLMSSDASEGMVSTASVLLPSGSTAPVMVTITGQNDDFDDGDVPYTIVTGDPTSAGDAVYDSLTAADVADVQVTNQDDSDTAGIDVTPSAVPPLVTDETGLTATYDVVLTSQPSADVVILVFTSDSSEGTPDSAMLTFTTINWNMAQTVTVTGQNDFIDDGNVAYSLVNGNASSGDPGYDGLDPADVLFVNNDDADTAGVLVTPNQVPLVTTEIGGTDTFDVVLQSQPAPNNTVTMTIQSSNINEGTVSTNMLSFDGSNWNMAQTVTVTGVDDVIADGDVAYQIQIGNTVSFDPAYSGIVNADVACINQDNEVAAVIVSPTSGLVTTESGGSDSFTVVLAVQPTADVNIPISSSDPSEGVPDTALLTFTNMNWNMAQTVTVTGADDALFDGDIAYTIVTGDPTSGDAAFDALTAADVDDVDAVNLDDEICGPVTITAILGGPITVEGTPGCAFDLYDTGCSSDPNDWILVAAGVVIPASGSILVPGVIAQPDTCYLVTSTGNVNQVLGFPVATVPTLGEWALIAFALLLLMAGLYQMRLARRLAIKTS